jgi:F0F1-type ATP synthase assembly protein I
MAENRQPENGAGERQGWALVDAAWQIVGSVAFCGVVGYFADRHFGTKPWLFVGGMVFGIVSGMTLFLKTVLSLDAKRRAQDQKHDGVKPR